MAIASSNIKYYRSEVVNNTSANGGGMSTNQIPTASANNVWPNVLQSELLAGSDILRKIFIKVDTDDNALLADVLCWNDYVTPGGDRIKLWKGTLTDTAADTDDSVFYVAATIVSASGTTVIINLENADMAGAFVNGTKVRITNKALPDSTSGDEEFRFISGAPSLSGVQQTINLDDTLTGTYVAGDKFEAVCELGDIQAVINSFVVTSSAGTYDDTNYPVVPNNSNAIHETVTITFSDATYFVPVSNKRGTLATGNVTEDYEDADGCFTIPYLAFGGTYVNGDTIVMEIYPSALSVWLERIIPAGATSYANNSNLTVVYGQSA